MEYLEINNLKKKYGDFSLNVNFSVKEGEFLCLIGPSGSGKSTVLSLLTGLEEADEGMIVLDGEDITAKSTQERNIGLVFQDYALFSNMNVEKNIQYGMDKKHKSSKEISEQTELLLEYVDLVGYGKRKVTSLSGGEAQRVALARSLASEPKILLLDGELLLDRLKLLFLGGYEILGVVDVLLRDLPEEALVLDFLIKGVILPAVGYIVHLGLVLFKLCIAFHYVVLVLQYTLSGIVNHLVDTGGLCLQVCYLMLQTLYFKRKLTPELKNLVNLCVSLLECVQSLKLLLDTQIRICKALLDGYKGLPLVNRSLDFFCLLSHIA